MENRVLTATTLSGLTMGLIGYRGIARVVAEIARSFGMRVIAHRRSGQPAGDIRLTDLEALLRESEAGSPENVVNPPL